MFHLEGAALTFTRLIPGCIMWITRIVIKKVLFFSRLNLLRTYIMLNSFTVLCSGNNDNGLRVLLCVCVVLLHKENKACPMVSPFHGLGWAVTHSVIIII